ncbi:MAG: beta-aspartyl-peptidase [Negativicutes bacterium]|jgi:beta-aspartyl-dipeptidase (metallo-type)
MFLIVRNCELYNPEPQGRRDIVVCSGKIIGVFPENSTQNFEQLLPESDVQVIDVGCDIVTPGFIDNHVHIAGAGGEGGYAKRTPEIQISDIISAGVTTVIGVLGTDSVARCNKTLLAKAYQLEAEGISTWILTGSYEIPVQTLTGSCKSDIVLVDKIIGTGEVAISDHRSSQPSFDEFVRCVADTRVGGVISGKAGVVNVHIGDGNRKLEMLMRMVRETEIPIKQVIPTHINRTAIVMGAGLEFAKLGGYVDLTTSSDPRFLEEDEVKASTGMKKLLNWNIKPEQILFSSDAQGSMPIFNDQRELIGIGVGEVRSLYRETRDAVIDEQVPLEIALMAITSNPAEAYKLLNKGQVKKDFDADMVVLDKDDLQIKHVIAKGKIVVQDGVTLIKGMFEK